MKIIEDMCITLYFAIITISDCAIASLKDWFDPVIEMEMPDEDHGAFIVTERVRRTRKRRGGYYGESSRTILK